MICIESLHNLLAYDAMSGKLIWRARDGSDAKRWNQRYAGKEVGSINHNGYLRTKIYGKLVMVHRVIWAMAHGNWPANSIDHINGNPADNRLCNLRDVSHAENMRNRRGSGAVLGVRWRDNNKKWHVKIGREYVGVFADYEAAIAARKRSEAQLGYHENHGRAA